MQVSRQIGGALDTDSPADILNDFTATTFEKSSGRSREEQQIDAFERDTQSLAGSFHELSPNLDPSEASFKLLEDHMAELRESPVQNMQNCQYSAEAVPNGHVEAEYFSPEFLLLWISFCSQ